MTRILLILLVLGLVFLVARKLMSAARGTREKLAGEKLVKCRYCGIYVSESSAITDGEDTFCSDEHRNLDRE